MYRSVVKRKIGYGKHEQVTVTTQSYAESDFWYFAWSLVDFLFNGHVGSLNVTSRGNLSKTDFKISAELQMHLF